MPGPSIQSLQAAVKAFTSSPSIFQIIHSLPASPVLGSVSTLLILDSSFNPPTKAHEYLVEQAIARVKHSDASLSTSSSEHRGVISKQARILLLLSTKNADKPSTPASTAERLKMMILFAQEIWTSLSAGFHSSHSVPVELNSSQRSTSAEEQLSPISGIDIALSTEPRFLEKSIFLNEPGENNLYLDNNEQSEGLAQWHLLGFDTLIRLLDVKYYPPDHSLKDLRPLFENDRNRILVVKRDDSSDEQEKYVHRLGISQEDKGFHAPGWNISWSQRIELVEAYTRKQGQDGDTLTVSSTAVRRAARDENDQSLKQMVSDTIAEYILQEGLYKN